MAWLDKLREAGQQLEKPYIDPWQRTLERALQGVEAMSTPALLDLLDARPTTANARRLAAVMRQLRFVPIKSRRLEPGGIRDTIARGWARPVRGQSPLALHKPHQGKTS